MIEPVQILFGYILGIASGFGIALFIGYKKDKKESEVNLDESV